MPNPDSNLALCSTLPVFEPVIPPDRIVQWQDGAPLQRGTLLEQAGHLAQRLKPGQRFALRSSRADQVAVAVLACQHAGAELLLSRSAQPREPETWRAWNVSLVLDDKLNPEWEDNTGSTVAPASEGAHILIETSGTTGIPKVARHSLATLMGRIRTKSRREGEIRWLLTYHPASFAGLQVLLTALAYGDGLISVSQIAVPALVATALAHRPTHISATPTFWRSFLMAAGERAPEVPLVQATLGGEIVEQSILDQLRQTYPGAGITHIYASTEAGALFAVKDGRSGFPASWLAEGIDGVQLRLRDGVLEVLSPRKMQAYVGGTPAPLTEDGWINTGDLVEQRGDRAFFLGRANTLISVGGAKVMPEEVEAVLLNVPGVLEARVYGVKNPITGSLVAAEIVTREPDQNALRGQILTAARAGLDAAYKVPRMLRFVDRIEASATGKKQRNES